MPMKPKNYYKICLFCVCEFFDLLASFFDIFFVITSSFFVTHGFYISKTEVCEGISSCVMEAKKSPKPILAARRLIKALSRESGVHFREGAQRVFVCELHVMVGYTKTHISTTYRFTSVKLRFVRVYPLASWKPRRGQHRF